MAECRLPCPCHTGLYGRAVRAMRPINSLLDVARRLVRQIGQCVNEVEDQHNAKVKRVAASRSARCSVCRDEHRVETRS